MRITDLDGIAVLCHDFGRRGRVVLTCADSDRAHSAGRKVKMASVDSVESGFVVGFSVAVRTLNRAVVHSSRKGSPGLWWSNQ